MEFMNFSSRRSFTSTRLFFLPFLFSLAPFQTANPFNVFVGRNSFFLKYVLSLDHQGQRLEGVILKPNTRGLGWPSPEKSSSQTKYLMFAVKCTDLRLYNQVNKYWRPGTFSHWILQ